VTGVTLEETGPAGDWPGNRVGILGSFGSQLRETREARGLSLEAVADATRIVPRHLAALERSDVEALPAGPFAKGYIEAYSQLLGIDPDPILEAYRTEGRQRGLDAAEAQDRIIEEFSQIVEQRAGATRRLGRLPGGRKGLALVLVGGGLLGSGGWLLNRVRLPQPPAFAPARTEPAPPMGSVAPEAPPREARALPTAVPPRSEPRSPEEPASASAPAVIPKAAPAVAPRAAQPTTSFAVGELEVSHSGVGTGVENNRLVGRSDQFEEGSSVAFWTRVLGGRPGDVIHHVWLHEGQPVTLAELTLGGSHWRTHSRRLLDPGLTGRWVVEARHPDGEVLAHQEFLCVAGER